MKTKLILSSITAFIIASGGALGVVFVGGQPSLWQVLAAVVLGLVVAAKDARSLLALPPVNGDADAPRVDWKPPVAIGFGLIGLVGLTGCAALKDNPDLLKRVEAASKMAAFVGTSEYVRQHPETRFAFELVRDELKDLGAAEKLDLVTLLSAVNHLPIKELKNERATMIVTAAGILLTDYADRLPVEKLSTLQPVALAIAGGINLGLEQ